MDDTKVDSKPKTYNRFVSQGARFEYGIDIMYMESNYATSDTLYGLVAIDNFTKISRAIPIKNRTPAEIIIGLKGIFESMGKPKQLYSDEESSMRSSKMNRFLNDTGVKSTQTTTHAHTVGRAIRTFKDNLNRILYALKQDKRMGKTYFKYY